MNAPEKIFVPTAKQITEQALRKAIEDLSKRCTEKQVAFLHKIHDSAPWKGLDRCPENKLTETYELLRRTVISNQKENIE